MSIIKIDSLTKIYGKDTFTTLALDNVNLQIDKGEFISIMGPSGSGKTTLLNIIGCMDTGTNGEYWLDKVNVSSISNNKLWEVRRKYISFVFQHFALLKDYTIYENIELPLLYRGLSERKRKEKIMYYMSRLGIEELAKKKPAFVSGGQQQRVAIARALVSEASVILADEPTGSLDQKTGEELLNLLKDINQENKTVILVTHDMNVAKYTDRIINIADGKITNDAVR